MANGCPTGSSRLRKYRRLMASPLGGFYFRTRNRVGAKDLREQRIKLLFFYLHIALGFLKHLWISCTKLRLPDPKILWFCCRIRLTHTDLLIVKCACWEGKERIS